LTGETALNFPHRNRPFWFSRIESFLQVWRRRPRRGRRCCLYSGPSSARRSSSPTTTSGSTRAADAFRENRALADDAPAAAAAFAEGKKQLEVAKRQAVVYSLYAPKAKNIMEIKLQ
jgi:hypothetical protein